MTPEQWQRLTPEQQAWHWRQHEAELARRAGPPPVAAAPTQTPARQVNVAAIVAAVSGLLGLLVLPIILGPVAAIAGFVGAAQAPKLGRGGRLASLGVVLGLIITLVAVQRLEAGF